MLLFCVMHCHKVMHFSTDLPQLSTYVIYYLIKVLHCEGRVVRSVNFLLTDTVMEGGGGIIYLALPNHIQGITQSTQKCSVICSRARQPSVSSLVC